MQTFIHHIKGEGEGSGGGGEEGGEDALTETMILREERNLFYNFQ